MQLLKPEHSTSREERLESEGTNVLKRASQGSSQSEIYQSIKYGKVERNEKIIEAKRPRKCYQCVTKQYQKVFKVFIELKKET